MKTVLLPLAWSILLLKSGPSLPFYSPSPAPLCPSDSTRDPKQAFDYAELSAFFLLTTQTSSSNAFWVLPGFSFPP